MSKRLIRNSAKCCVCEQEIESTHRHFFVVHYCLKAPKVWERKWVDGKLVDTDKLESPHFFVDGGLDYERRGGNLAYENTSQYE